MEHIQTATHAMLDNFMDTLIRTGEAPVPFVILAWPTWSGKTRIALAAAEKLLGEYMRNDLLALYDCTRELEKPHVIKISNDEEITRQDGTVIQDLGIREVHQWIARSPAGKRKVLFIEHIERLTDSSANALLKICEEPLPHRLIIATSSQKEWLLPTILSRALVFPFATGDYALTQSIADEEAREIVQWGIAMLFDAKQQLTPVYTRAVQINKAGYVKEFMLAVSQHAAQQQLRDKVILAHTTYRTLDMAISTDHLLFDFLCQRYAA